MNLSSERAEIEAIFRREHEIYHQFPLGNVTQAELDSFIGAYYAADVIVVHAHHDNNPHHGNRQPLAVGHPHVVIGLRGYISNNFSTQIEKFYELYHTLQWMSIRDHGNFGLAVVGLVMEGAEKLRAAASLPARDLHNGQSVYHPCYSHLGVWVMRKDLSDTNNTWQTRFVLSGLPLPPVTNNQPAYQGKISPNEKAQYKGHFDNGNWPANLQPKPPQFSAALPAPPPPLELLGWEVVINGL